jgi:hypothetical protein
MSSHRRILYFCGGLQGSGSTLVSWCFLQRADLNGILDANSDLLEELPPILNTAFAWYKCTISCFRLQEIIGHFTDDDWEVHPLLVIRDVRVVFASLLKKKYGRNGTTAEDPPLRMRMRRFKSDWELFRQEGWPILRYESFVEEPRQVLRKTCDKLGLAWDEGMITWPKGRAGIADSKRGNTTFWSTAKQNLLNTIRPISMNLQSEDILSGDLVWLEKEFEEFNYVCNYPAHLKVIGGPDRTANRAIPRYELTRRYMRQDSLIRKIISSSCLNWLKTSSNNSQ